MTEWLHDDSQALFTRLEHAQQNCTQLTQMGAAVDLVSTLSEYFQDYLQVGG